MPRFLKIKYSRNDPKNDRERDNDDGGEDLARFWTIRISLGAGSKYVRPKTLISRIYLHRDSYSNWYLPNSSIPNYNRDSYTNGAETNCRKYSDITAHILILLQGKYELCKTVRDPLRRRHYLAPCNFLWRISKLLFWKISSRDVQKFEWNE